MKKQSDTPRTDAEYREHGYLWTRSRDGIDTEAEMVPVEFAKELERELQGPPGRSDITDAHRLACIATLLIAHNSADDVVRNGACAMGDKIESAVAAGLKGGKSPLKAMREAIDPHIELRESSAP